ncbi:MAG: DUF1343 domain-containing protein [Candidatus Marinimicrobia bacterium]|nr:DUF1343 domain-containing protein [Candidatus Neomarinimicrobiota bacterium]
MSAHDFTPTYPPWEILWKPAANTVSRSISWTVPILIGRLAEGPVLQQDYQSFIGMYPIPIRHGMTVGELALMIRDNGWVDHTDALELHVVEASGWDPQKSYEATGLTWVDPSRNMRNVNEALVYPGMCLFEGTNFNEGRGTGTSFRMGGRGVHRRGDPAGGTPQARYPGGGY